MSPARCRKTAICAAPPCAPRWAAFTCARSANPASKAFSAAALRVSWKAGRRRAGCRSDQRDRGAARQRLSEETQAARRIPLGPRPLRPRRLFPRPPRPRRQARRAGGAGGGAAVLCGRGDLAEFFLDRAWGEGFGREGGGGNSCFGREAMTVAFRSFVIAGLDPAIYPLKSTRLYRTAKRRFRWKLP